MEICCDTCPLTPTCEEIRELTLRLDELDDVDGLAWPDDEDLKA